MGLAIITLGILAVVLVIIKVLNLNIMGISVVILCIALIFTAGICFTKPIMHKQFSIDIVDYLIKFNDDGTMSTTKQTTKTILKRNETQQKEVNK